MSKARETGRTRSTATEATHSDKGAAGSVSPTTKADNTNSSNASSLSGTADEVVSRLHKTDGKLNRIRHKLLDDPDTLGDKVTKTAVPSLVGLVGGKVFQSIWDHTVTKSRKGGGKDSERESAHQQGVAMSIVFAVLSAAFGALLSEISTRGTQAFITKRQGKRR